ncbi:glycosyltransferase involved in cell wall biosynthesis [Roseimicrobium gellanilyticum]|uniref:Glycosyltransferase involved in cell wall biosynthesis n=1 Tax=Roseimicrobium gellanilyticum TaxID=748857 RepID=A0A366HR57_9BACT|nr:glycosyltransferase [Roseimicrobium gellanilyticum]RBP45329.1 glycosyltransferase involved in cell wall biosynthesis [Roseimicrobium gellanilyticum]
MTAKILLVIPCYNESGRIGPFLSELCALAEPLGSTSILVVEDGSSPEEQDRLRELVNATRMKYPFVREPLLLSSNLGKGGAVYAGWLAHQSEEWLGFVDADGACSASETVRLARLLIGGQTSVDAIFASRIQMLGHRIQRHLHRHIIGRIYATIVSILLDIPVHDSQCGLKFIRRSAYARVFPTLEVKDFGFDIELMAALTDSGAIIEEMPIDWHEVRGGKLRLFRDALCMLGDVLQVRRRRRMASWLAHLKGSTGAHLEGTSLSRKQGLPPSRNV